MNPNQSSGHGFSVLQRITWLISGEAPQLLSQVVMVVAHTQLHAQQMSQLIISLPQVTQGQL